MTLNGSAAKRHTGIVLYSMLAFDTISTSLVFLSPGERCPFFLVS